MRSVRKRVAAGIGLAVLLGLVACAVFQSSEDREALADLKRYTPYGHHFIDTINTEGTVKWTSREAGLWGLKERRREFGSVEEFEAAFLKAEVDRRAAVEVHSPALRLDVPEGRAAHERAETILAFLAEHGYENSGPISD